MKEGSEVSGFSAAGENGSRPSLSLELESLLLERRVERRTQRRIERVEILAKDSSKYQKLPGFNSILQ